MSTLQTLALAGLLAAGAASVGDQMPTENPLIPDTALAVQELVAIQGFHGRVAEYVALHRHEAEGIPEVQVTHDIALVHQAVKALGLRIRTARAGAQQGDIITPDVARVFRRRIAGCLTPAQWAALFAAAAEEAEEEGLAPAPPLRVNMDWPEQVPFEFVPPQLLQALPRLPPELQFRIIGRALVLWDVHANLIVDVLPAAFAGTT